VGHLPEIFDVPVRGPGLLGDGVSKRKRTVSKPKRETEQHVVYFFNNCRNRDHVALFGSGAFFDLYTTGRQGAQARDVAPGQLCVVAERTPDKQIAFDWYAFNYEALLPDEHGVPDRVFFGRHFASETMSKGSAAASDCYAALFASTGHFKRISVVCEAISSALIPAGFARGAPFSEGGTPITQSGAGFGDAAENKLVETRAVRAVIKHYEQSGWSVRSVERDKCGFDLECKKAGTVEQLEVKGVRGSGLCFVITAGEVKQARENPKFFLMVVTSALSSSPTLTKFSGREFGQRFNLSAIQYRAAFKK
jgi:hypothetical protein